MVRVTPDDDTTVSVEDAYIDALVNDEMVSSANEGGLSDDAPDSPIRRSKRYLVIFITFLANVSIPLCTRNIVFALQPMVNHSAVQHDRPLDYQKETCHPLDVKTASRIDEKPRENGIYAFSDDTQSHILGDPFIAQMGGTFVALYIFDLGTWNENNIYATCLFMSGILNLLLPLIAYYGGSIGIIISRIAIGFYTGIMTPTNYMTARTWAQPSECDMAIAVMYAGGSVGSVLFAFAGALADSVGWESLFYIPGAFQLLCSVLIYYYCSSEGKRRTTIKWYKALKSLKYWAILFATFGYYWSSEGILVYTVNYLHDMHGYSDRQIAYYSSLPTNMSMFLMGVIAPWLTNILIEKKWVGKVTIRRIGGILCSLAGIPLILMGTLSCAAVEDGIVPILVLSSIRAGYYISIAPTINELQKDQKQLFTFS